MFIKLNQNNPSAKTATTNKKGAIVHVFYVKFPMRDKNPKRKKLHRPLWPIPTPIKPNMKRQEEIQQEGIVERKEVE